jgi:xylulokinase
VIEGVTAGMGLCLRMIRDAGVPVRDLAASGGGFRGAFWAQCCADAFGAPLVRIAGGEGAALGAALLAAVGAGAHASVQDAVRAMRVTDRVEPRASEAEFWGARMRELRDLHARLGGRREV